jgi:ferredoxin-type protein NapH
MKRQTIRKTMLLILLLLFPAIFSYLSPYLIIEGAFLGVATGSFVVFALMFLFSLVFGRAFCGWLCPAGGLQDCARLAVDKRAKGKWRDWIKYVIWVPWLGFIIAGFLAAGGVKAVDFFFWTDNGLSVTALNMLIIYLFVTIFLAVSALIWGRRAACHYFCWMAPFMVIGTKLKNALGYPSLHLAADPTKCSGCKQCSKKCPMSLDVDAMVKRNNMKNTECILCGECVDGCPRKVICYRMDRAKNRKGNFSC